MESEVESLNERGYQCLSEANSSTKRTCEQNGQREWKVLDVWKVTNMDAHDGSILSDARGDGHHRGEMTRKEYHQGPTGAATPIFNLNWTSRHISAPLYDEEPGMGEGICR
ncbi:hypothetical protein E2P81_ATG03747 [Venturia nashicola]|uniref:Uncharacterized protein n=1 Tax=Venturia nashicola TaxID=86259 RepID=A0A4Z1PEN9_9PEZI|nr:hypothetical protein E6O75_ATG03832 [Venturia nashicola]TLD38072.1 hypothetical protein E2P81_ATG03747 [Venturia nashicola]